MKHYIQVFGRQIELTEEQAKALQEQYAPPSVKLSEVKAKDLAIHSFRLTSYVLVWVLIIIGWIWTGKR